MPELDPRRFSALIAGYELGSLDVEASEQLANLMHQCRARKGKGTLTLKLTLDPSNEDGFEVIIDVEAKAPKAPRLARVYYATTDGSALTRRSPLQPELWDEPAPQPPAGVDAETGEVWADDDDPAF